MDDAHRRTWICSTDVTSWNSGESFFSPSLSLLSPLGDCPLPIQLLLPDKSRMRRPAGDFNMAEPLGRQGALAGAPQSAWIPVDLIPCGWRLAHRSGTGQRCLKIGINSTRTPRSTYPRWTWSSRFPRICPVTATASGCGGLSSPPPWSLSLGVSSLSSCGELWNIFGPCAATVTPRRRYVGTPWNQHAAWKEPVMFDNYSPDKTQNNLFLVFPELRNCVPVFEFHLGFKINHKRVFF